MYNVYQYYPELPIAKWKINSKLESVLGNAADNSILGKKMYVFFYWLFDHAYYVKGKKYIKEYIKKFGPPHIDKKSLERDMIYSLHRFGVTFDEYFLFKFYNLNACGRSEFIGDKVRWTYMDKFNSRSKKDLFDDKSKTYEVYKTFYHRDVQKIIAQNDLPKLEKLLAKHDRVLVKPLDSNCGKGIAIYSSKELCGSQSSKLLEIYPKGCIVEEILIQRNEIADIHPYSLNTLRLHVVKSPHSMAYFPFLRVGRNRNIVDNAGAGGIIGAIDVRTGIITDAADEAGERFILHPDTGKQIIGFKVPQWEDALAMGKELMNIVPTQHSVAWDLALVDGRWCLIEANFCGQFVGQYATLRGIKHEMDKMLVELMEEGN